MEGPTSQAESISVFELIERCATAALGVQRDDGSFPQQETSYYNDPQLPVRTTSQWLRVFSEMYSITKDSRYEMAAEDAASFLISKSRPHGYTFHCRDNKNKDKCNGVYGQAMPVWALTTAAEHLDRDELYTVAEDVVMHHPYDEHLSLWNRVEINGEILPIDRTLNHQLAFAAAVSTIKSEHCQTHVLDFLDNLEELIGVRSDGIIRHFVQTPLIHTGQMSYRNRLTSLRNKVLFEVFQHIPTVRKKEVSYQAANLFWLSYLKKQYPVHALWDTDLVDRIVGVVQTNDFKIEVEQTHMAFTASPTGFYIAVALEIFEDDLSDATEWIAEQINYTFNLNTERVVSGVSDRIKMASNICYLTELPDLETEITVRV